MGANRPIIPPPPPGFEIDTPPPPPGFVLDAPTPAQNTASKGSWRDIRVTPSLTLGDLVEGASTSLLPAEQGLRALLPKEKIQTPLQVPGAVRGLPPTQIPGETAAGMALAPARLIEQVSKPSTAALIGGTMLAGGIGLPGMALNGALSADMLYNAYKQGTAPPVPGELDREPVARKGTAILDTLMALLPWMREAKGIRKADFKEAINPIKKEVKRDIKVFPQEIRDILATKPVETPVKFPVVPQGEASAPVEPYTPIVPEWRKERDAKEAIQRAEWDAEQKAKMPPPNPPDWGVPLEPKLKQSKIPPNPADWGIPLEPKLPAGTLRLTGNIPSNEVGGVTPGREVTPPVNIRKEGALGLEGVTPSNEVGNVAPGGSVATPKARPKTRDELLTEAVNYELQRLSELMRQGGGELSGKGVSIELQDWTNMTYTGKRDTQKGYGKVRVKPKEWDILTKQSPSQIAPIIDLYLKTQKTKSKFLKGLIEKLKRDINEQSGQEIDDYIAKEAKKNTVDPDADPDFIDTDESGSEGFARIKDDRQKGMNFTPIDIPGQSHEEAALALIQKILNAPDSNVSKRDLLGIKKKQKKETDTPLLDKADRKLF